jgi:hypothetical protein
MKQVTDIINIVNQPYDSPNKTMMQQIKDPSDLYNRKGLLQRSLERLDEELDKVDRDDILTLVQFQNDNQNELLWMYYGVNSPQKKIKDLV